jgi:hypothetical protein
MVDAMRTQFMCFLCAGLIGLLSAPQVRAQSEPVAHKTPSPEAIFADVVLVRPMAFAATIIGTAVFLVALPVAAISKSVQPTANALVVKPAQATFTRPLGDFEALQ